MLHRTVSDVARELTGEAWCIGIATVEDFDVIAAIAAIDLAELVVRIATDPVGASF